MTRRFVLVGLLVAACCLALGCHPLGSSLGRVDLHNGAAFVGHFQAGYAWGRMSYVMCYPEAGGSLQYPAAEVAAVHYFGVKERRTYRDCIARGWQE